MSGVGLWLWQRGTALVLLAYTLVWVFLCQEGLVWGSYDTWLALWSGTWFRVMSSVVLTALCVHAIIGVWMVMTDYLHAGVVRVCLVGVWYGSMALCWFWGLGMLWGLT